MSPAFQPQASIVLWKLQGNEAIRVADLTLPLRDILECGMIEYRKEYFSFLRLEGSLVYFMMCGGVLEVDSDDPSVHGHF